MLSTGFIVQKLSLIPPGCSAGIWAGILFTKWYEGRSISKHHEIMDSMRIFSKNALTYRGQPFYHTSKDEVYPATTNDGKLPIFRVIIVQQNTRNKILPKIQIHISGAVIGNGQNICSFQGTKPWNL
ncbi:uncharacterized protein [Henckelia pumila]|uniref:uncharacterized protein isoform X3 n=1 Tax=Henckelia pumila TaxID=405737 RepID=UPI003C6E6E6B